MANSYVLYNTVLQVGQHFDWCRSSYVDVAVAVYGVLILETKCIKYNFKNGTSQPLFITVVVIIHLSVVLYMLFNFCLELFCLFQSSIVRFRVSNSYKKLFFHWSSAKFRAVNVNTYLLISNCRNSVEHNRKQKQLTKLYWVYVLKFTIALTSLFWRW